MNEEIKKKILEYMSQNKLTVISTVDLENNKPEAAVIGFAEKENLELIFGTSNKTRKYKNIQSNPKAAFVIGWDGRFGTIQYEGIAEEVPQELSKEYSAIMVNKNPFSAKFAENPDQRYFLVKPKWLRFTDMSVSPNEIHEFNF